MKININGIESFRSPDSHQVTFDDRQQKVEVFAGTVIQDLGTGSPSFSVTAMFTRDNFVALAALWAARTPVTYIDEGGLVWTNCRLSLKSYKYVSRFPLFVTGTFEIWQIPEGM